MICAFLVHPKFDLYILTPVTLISKSNKRWICHLVDSHQMCVRCKFGDRRPVSCRDITRPNFFYDDLKPDKIGQGDLTYVLVCSQSSVVGLCMRDNKSLYAAVTICTTIVNMHTHTHTAFWPAFMNSSSSYHLLLTAKGPWSSLSPILVNQVWDYFTFLLTVTVALHRHKRLQHLTLMF